MRKQIGIYSNYITISIVFSIISSISIIAIVFLGKNESVDKALRIIFPIVFWLGLIGEQFFMWKANSIRKSVENSGTYRKIKSKIGLVSFFENEAGFVADIVLMISLIGLIVMLAAGIGEKIIQYIFIFLLVLSFRLHCILNGKNFRYKKYLAKRKVDYDV